MVLAEWGKQALVTTAGRELWVPEHFPWLKETMNLRIPNLWMSWRITRIPLKRNTCQSGGISDQSIWTKRRLQQHHVSQWCQNFPISLPSTLFQHGPRNEDPEREREGTLQKWTHLHFLVGPLASVGERETVNRLNMRWSWHLTDLDLGNPEWWDAWNGCKVMQEMRMQWKVGDDSPWGGWARSHFYLLWSQPLCPPEISYDETLILMVMVTLGGAFVRW